MLIPVASILTRWFFFNYYYGLYLIFPSFISLFDQLICQGIKKKNKQGNHHEHAVGEINQ